MTHNPLALLEKLRRLRLVAARAALSDANGAASRTERLLREHAFEIAAEATAAAPKDFADWLPVAQCRLAELEGARTAATQAVQAAHDALVVAQTDLEAVEELQRMQAMQHARDRARAERTRMDEAAHRRVTAKLLAAE